MSFVYFAALTAIAWLRPLPSARRAQITAIGLLSCVAVVAARDWRHRGPRLDAAAHHPRRLFSVGQVLREPVAVVRGLVDRRGIAACSAIPPRDSRTGRARCWRTSKSSTWDASCSCRPDSPRSRGPGAARSPTRYWTLVTAAEFGSFASLGVVQARPPWMVERKAVLSDRSVHRAASMMVEHLTIRANTFPSGHVAGSLAAALAVMRAMPGLGLVLLFLAGSIAAACIVGRYHYIVDVVTGVLLTVLIWSVVT